MAQRPLERLQKKTLSLRDNIQRIANLYAALPYVVGYAQMFAILSKESNVEVDRYAQLKTNVMQWLRANATTNLQYFVTEGIPFDPSKAGTYRDMVRWQVAGYKTNRTQLNAEIRARRFRSIFYGYNIGNRGGFISAKGSKKRLTYQDVIRQRMQGYQGKKVPYWLSLEYGVQTSLSPVAYPGIGFRRIAVAATLRLRGLVKDYFKRFVSRVIRGKEQYSDYYIYRAALTDVYSRLPQSSSVLSNRVMRQWLRELADSFSQ